MTNDTRDRHPNVAVVVVHGVGPHDAGASARAVGDLLLNLDADGSSAAYTPFAEEQLRVRTRRLEPCAKRTEKKPLYEDRSPLLRARYAAAAPSTADAPPPASQSSPTEPSPAPEFLFMQGQLLDFKGDGPDDQYQTIRLNGARLDAAGEIDRAVHVYEMYWSDLVRVGNGALDVFVQLYQILFHLPSLGRHAVDYGRVLRPDRLWKWFSDAQFMAERLLTIGVPVLNLLLLVVATTFLPMLLPDVVWLGHDLGQWLAGGVGAFAVLTAASYWAFRVARWRMIVFGAVAAAVTVLLLIIPRSPYVLCVEWLALGLAAHLLVFRAYDRQRPWALPASFVAVGGLLLFVAGDLCLRGSQGAQPVVATEMLRGAEVVVAALVVCWGAFLAMQMLAFFCGVLARRSAPAATRDAVARITGTARLSLSLPTVLFLLLTIPVAALVYSRLARLLATKLPEYTPMLPWPALAKAHPYRVQHVVDAFVKLSATEGFLLIIGLAIAALVLALASLLPSVIAELNPPRTITPENSLLYGHWVTRALGVLAVCAELLMLASTFAIPAGFVAHHFRIFPTNAMPLFRWLSLALPGSAIGLLGLRGRFQSLALGLRSPLDAVLDVDTYLRERPSDDTPRARICARYVSLLRYLRSWRSPTGHGYDAIVIVAHSQGTVISADILRFMRRFGDPVMADGGAPIQFFTMGSPLRQLYAARFPDLYGWLGHSPGADNAVADAAKPIPSELGVTQWVNAYRSGDYVGRALWTGLDSPDVWNCGKPGPSSTAWRVDLPPSRLTRDSDDRTRREFCVGPGAHTHYWDDDGASIAVQLDELIAAATPLP